jgi:hypothetical protein
MNWGWTMPAKVRERPKRIELARKRELDALAKKQGYKPFHSVQELYGDFWPADEKVDEFVATVRKWRNEGHRRTAKK